MVRGSRSIAFVLHAPGRAIALAPGSYVIGRVVESDIVFEDDPKLSRRHARLVVSEDAVEVEDLGSTNGTWVDTYFVQHRLRVTKNAILRIGDLELSIERAAGRAVVPAAIRATAPDVPQPESGAADSNREVPTQQNAGYEHAKTVVLHFLDSGELVEAKRTLDPILAQMELTSRSIDPISLDTIAELAFRVALATSEASYVDAAVRVHCAHSGELSDANVSLLETCIASGLEPDPRNADAYLASLGDSSQARRGNRERVQSLLTAPLTTLPAPAPDSGH